MSNKDYLNRIELIIDQIESNLYIYNGFYFITNKVKDTHNLRFIYNIPNSELSN
jgi:hypothetical protein